MKINKNPCIFEYEMGYFEDASKLKFYYFKHLQENRLDSKDQIIELKGLLNNVEDDVTARTQEKPKREMSLKSDERHVEEDMFVGENLEGRHEPKTKRS